MKRKVVFIALLSLAANAWAIDSGPSSKQQQQTETWLQLQPSAKAASPIPQTATPAERDLSLQRWLNSYSHEIPEFFEQEKGGKISDK
ncbi:DUF3613 domain-containing protein [Pseudomonas syringae]|uniref:DUF3613 domain-containing protein n=1 Tax=Pseudomonas syringae TaxID=317 RepID=A0A085V8Z7_PSESX|nr:DUF3613 domain-containing protein [Pseudomonas syringae]KFE51910.1 hypothetical protein IV01_22560 [Pseudomonas syringae]